MNRSAILKNRNDDGLFYTWILPPPDWGKNDIDAIVNTNTIAYLGEDTQSKNAIEFICDLVRSNNEDEFIYYYVDKRCLYYFISKAYAAGIIGFEKCKDAIIEKLIDDTSDSENELSCALVLTTLINLGFHKKNILSHRLAKIIDTARDNGSWAGIPFYQGGKYPQPVAIYWGSESITTAVCLEALLHVISANIQV